MNGGRLPRALLAGGPGPPKTVPSAINAASSPPQPLPSPQVYSSFSFHSHTWSQSPRGISRNVCHSPQLPKTFVCDSGWGVQRSSSGLCKFLGHHPRLLPPRDKRPLGEFLAEKVCAVLRSHSGVFSPRLPLYSVLQTSPALTRWLVRCRVFVAYDFEVEGCVALLS